MAIPVESRNAEQDSAAGDAISLAERENDHVPGGSRRKSEAALSTAYAKGGPNEHKQHSAHLDRIPYERENTVRFFATEQISAIRADGLGDVTESHILWTGDYGLPDMCSPLVTDRHVLLLASYGALACYDRTEGGEEPLWEEDFESIFAASPSRVGDRVYLISDEGKGWVIRPNDTGCERLAENDLGERCFASPAFQSGRIYIRGEEHLFCIGQRQRD